ncbi:hypothetical protein F6X40_27445 [Paraburkholderia sp. UCT31]|uniref:hypothetical protein n=1 Tax=Paraburkholderia sp. UCT31 TaxID=2615209 RepID=UPI001655CA25|nr:hypothetical protein [Paraburkholderia sp. UCT31]MBC8740396.1 hypothetical protein [Paraburkholderia sp. UCT31]
MNTNLVITEEAAKAKATALQNALKDLGIVGDLSRPKALEVIARLENEKNWSVLNAKQNAARKAQRQGTGAGQRPSHYDTGPSVCGVCNDTRIIEDERKNLWPCPQCRTEAIDGPGGSNPPASQVATVARVEGRINLTFAQLVWFWHELRDVPVTEDGLRLDDEFLFFRKGDELERVWMWFEAMHPDFVVAHAMRGAYAVSEVSTELGFLLSRCVHRVKFEVLDKYCRPQSSFFQGYLSREEALTAVACYHSINWYQVEYIGAVEQSSSRPEDAVCLDTVAEWVGCHYRRNFAAESAEKQREWIERFIEAHLR